MLRTLLILSILNYCFLAVAGRIMVTTPMDLNGVFDFRYDQAGDPLSSNPTAAATYGGDPTFKGARVGGRIQVDLTIINISTKQQTVVVKMLNPTASGGTQIYGNFVGSSTTYSFTPYAYLCGNSAKTTGPGDSNFRALTPATATNHDLSSLQATLTLPAASLDTNGVPTYSSRVIFTAIAAFVGSYDTGTSSSGTFRLNANFDPTFVIRVEEDTGAVLGSIRYTYSPANGPASVGYKPCNIAGGVSQITWEGKPPTNDTSPVYVNGGRPF